MYNWIDVLIRFWLTKEDTIIDVVFVFKILVFGLVPYCIFQGLKGFIEIRFFKPLNLFSIAIATIVHILLFFVLKQFYGTLLALSLSLMIAFVIMGLWSYYWCRKDIHAQTYFRFLYFFIVSLVLFSINHFINLYLPNIMGLTIALLLTAVGFLAFVLFGKIEFVKDVLSTFKFKFLDRFIK